MNATLLQLLGAFSFGAVMGWNLYFVNRYRTAVSLTDLASIAAAVGGAAVLALFPTKSDLFGAYGLGLAAGFFLYFLVLVKLVRVSSNFDGDWFLDGRRKALKEDQTAEGVASTAHPMTVPGGPVVKK